MTFDWQLIAALSIVALAASYVLWGFAKALRGKRGGCGGGCGTCSSQPRAGAASGPLVELGGELSSAGGREKFPSRR
jgi:hypothetical protein